MFDVRPLNLLKRGQKITHFPGVATAAFEQLDVCAHVSDVALPELDVMLNLDELLVK